MTCSSAPTCSTTPVPFLTYLRRRTSHDAALWVTAVDALDILMWFVDGGFHLEPTPPTVSTPADRRVDRRRSGTGADTPTRDARTSAPSPTTSTPGATRRRAPPPGLPPAPGAA